jgi:hypothetical protein
METPSHSPLPGTIMWETEGSGGRREWRFVEKTVNIGRLPA